MCGARRQAVAALSANPTGSWFTQNQSTGHDTNNDTKQDVFEGQAAEVIFETW
jgi:hypothetical protein